MRRRGGLGRLERVERREPARRQISPLTALIVGAVVAGTIEAVVGALVVVALTREVREDRAR